MKTFDISNRGLAAMALLVAALWTVIFFQRAVNSGSDPQEFNAPVTPVQTVPAPEPPPSTATWQAAELS